jgi:hypothetical protein
VPSEADRRRHDLVHAISWNVLEIFRPLLREEEWRDAYSEVYAIALAEVETHERLKARLHQCPEQKEGIS